MESKTEINLTHQVVFKIQIWSIKYFAVMYKHIFKKFPYLFPIHKFAFLPPPPPPYFFASMVVVSSFKKCTHIFLQ